MPKHYEDETKKVKTEVEEHITTDLSGSEDVYKMTMSAKVTTTTSMSATKTALRSLDARERDYTYDDAIEDYKTRVSQATKLDLPKIDINKKRELFEQQQQSREEENSNISTVAAKLGKNKQNSVTFYYFLIHTGTEIVSIKERISSLRSNLITNGTASTSALSSFTTAASATPPPKKVDLAVSTTIKDRLSSLHQQVSSPVDEASKRMLDTPFKNVHEARNEFELKQQQHLQPQSSVSYSAARVSEVAASFVEANESDEAHELSTDDHEDSDYVNPPPDVIQHESTNNSSFVSKESHDEINEEDSSVSYSVNDQIESVKVLNISDGSTTNINSSKLATSFTPLSPKISASNALMNFIHSNYQPFDDDNDENDEFQLSNKKSLEKSNSVDAALSMCSSSDGNSLMDDYKL